ncbi:unnamed protein product [Mytilus coruscus]|uniref:DNA-directed DNA polymerase n=1 Tax=Mytilus coruscus TaxID=42192 RepID=A0A6J7ZY46_MYTCO|nr:unnamed protein product [Mytilus coruscus]
MGPKKTFEDIISETTIDDIEEPDATKYKNLLKDKIVIDQFPLKIKIIITSEFVTPIAFDRIEKFEENNKVREHDHLSGKYRGAACQSCNTKEGKATKLIPVFFHNGSNYDFHFLIEELMKKEDKYNKVKLLSKNSENYISIDYGSYYEKLRFLDSYRFMLKGLSDVAKSMDNFPILEKEFEDANNLYGWFMSKKLPTKDFKWEEDPDYYKKVPKGRGCLIKCDLKYTDKCKKENN